MDSIAVISDIHGNILALEAVIADLERRAPALVINLGDMVSGPLWPNETARRLMAQNWLHIAGNHDINVTRGPAETLGPSDAFACRHLDRQAREWLASLAQTLRIDTDVLAFHGTAKNPNQYLTEQVERGRMLPSSRDAIRMRLEGLGATLVLCGHSHTPRCIQVDDGITIVNPGSVGQPAYTDHDDPPHIMEIGSPHARYALLEKRDPGWICHFLAIPYDWHAAAQKADRENRPDWSGALRSGCAQELSLQPDCPDG